MVSHALKKRTQIAGGWLLTVAIVIVGWFVFHRSAEAGLAG